MFRTKTMRVPKTVLAIVSLAVVSWGVCETARADSPPYLILRHGVAPSVIRQSQVANERRGIADGAGSIMREEAAESPEALLTPEGVDRPAPDRSPEAATPYGGAPFRALPYMAKPRHAINQQAVPRDPGPPRGYEVYAEPYAYGWFGVAPRQHRSRSYGYYGNYIQWSFR